MIDGIQRDKDHIESALEAAGMAWWSLEFPSGALSFSRNKTDMLGYKAEDFIHYSHFTNLIHPDDKDKAMAAMTDHYSGKKEAYEVTYRIKASDGTYKKFYDKGKIVEKLGECFIVAGVVSVVE